MQSVSASLCQKVQRIFRKSRNFQKFRVGFRVETAIKMAEWELSKENIQPLRQGRKVSAMLDPASDAKKITEEKQ